MSTASDLNLLDFNVNNLSGSCWEGQFKSHPCNLRGSCPIHQARQCLCSQYLLVAATACPQLYFDLADLLAPCRCHKLNFTVVEGAFPEECCQIPWHRSCWHRTHPGCSLLLARVYGSEGEQPARNHPTSKHVSSCVPSFLHVLQLPTAVHGCSYWHHHHHVGAVSLVVH